MMESHYGNEFLKVGVIALLAVMSPGPDFLMISRNSLVYSRRAGFFSALGLALGILVHVSYCLLGIALILSEAPALFRFIKTMGALYLIYLGVKVFLPAAKVKSKAENSDPKPVSISWLTALGMGFFTNILNPKATLFLFGLFTQIVDPGTPKLIAALYGLEVAVLTFLWFSLVVLILGHPALNRGLRLVQARVDKVFAIILIAVGLTLFF